MKLMKQIHPYLAVFTFCVLLAACSRHNNDPSMYKVKTQIVYSLPSNNPIDTIVDSNTYIYDSYGRQYQDIQNGKDTITWFYNASNITAVRTNPQQTTIYPLNSQGFISDYTTSEGRLYDNQGFLTVDTVYTVGGTSSTLIIYYFDFYTITNGNITCHRQVNPNGTIVNEFKYNFLNTLDTRDFGQSYFGSRSKNLVSTRTNDSCTSCQLPFTYVYKFDNTGRVIFEQSSPSIWSTYTYY